ncbi:MAG: class IV adenylate cyclase [Nitrospirae bacterium]|nr:class IV adenylate cyclase [Nitrospirota bacterium]
MIYRALQKKDRGPGRDFTLYETEIKILEIDRQTLENRLICMGARKIFDDEIHALYYDTADCAVRKRAGTLRLRREGERAVLTLKTDIEDSEAKVREEKEVGVSDFDIMMVILESSGFTAWLEMKKHRTSYELKGVRYEFDRHHGAYAYIPEFLEIEGPDTGTVYASAEALGFRKGDCRPWDIVQVAEYYSSRNRNTD